MNVHTGSMQVIEIQASIPGSSTNVALNKVATQSATLGVHSASYATDGVTDPSGEKRTQDGRGRRVNVGIRPFESAV